MIRMIEAEFLKYKNTFAKKLVFIAPMYVLIYSIWMNMYFYQNVINWWSLAIMPFTIAILCALSVIREKKAGQYRTLKSKDINIKNMWISKVIAIGSYTFLSSLMFIANILIVRLIFSGLKLDMISVISGVLVIWITTLLLIPICLFVAEKFGTFFAIAISGLGVIVEVIVTIGDKWFLWPWSLSMRLMCPIVKIHPNGCLLENGDKLLNPSVIPVGIIVGLLGFLVLTILTSIWFAKKEEK
ncbi:lantibiotic immunity ABC transporter MutE/EpiE family permease subunit [Clostridium ihumii]|uniref:lantibiotic immunity ABC transporter MutE/EpiE family permease subunit n=1 Tax=Clostridium ihumii TaxID=1470356 RepID=UPI00058CC2BB|nr:lantibiotic immunity ABC transporter MutE/EpiE family permease subunit [Clostridium ihumii]